MRLSIHCNLCGLTFEAFTATNGQRRTCPKCFNTGTVRMTDVDTAELDVKGGMHRMKNGRPSFG